MANDFGVSAALAAQEQHLLSNLGEARQLEVWSGHGDTRFPELRRIATFFPRGENLEILEVGCGNALASAYFSPIARRIVASDLPQVSHSEHAIGLDRAESLLRHVGVSNVRLLGASAERLPLASSSFDAVFGIYCLEHVSNKRAAVRESLRVLKPGGRAIFTVPAAAWSIVYFPSFYRELGERVVRRILHAVWPSNDADRAGGRSEGASAPSPASRRVVRDWRSFRKAYPHFPLPEPHGACRTFLEELESFRASSWRRLFLAEGCRDLQIAPLQVIPRALFSLLFGPRGARLYNRVFEGADLRLCHIRPLARLAQSLCIIATSGGGVGS